MTHSAPTRVLLGAALGALVALPATQTANAASHREAPLTALDQKADITDYFAFVSFDDPGRVTLILNVDPFQEPSNGPNYSPFDPEILYTIHVDNNHDARPDISFEFRFATEIRAPNVFTGFVGAGDGIDAPANSPPPVPAGTPIVPPAITALDGPGSEGFSLRQNYTVTLVEYHSNGRVRARTELSQGSTLFAVPANVGPRTMPDYESLVQQGIYDLADVKVFAGTVDDPFWIDLGAAFDTLNFRAGAVAPEPPVNGTGVPGVLSLSQDNDDANNFAPDDVSGFNVNAIAIEVPITMLTSDGQIHAASQPAAVIGSWGTTSRPRVKVLSTRPQLDARTSGSFVQVQRMGNPLINELIIGTGFKDEWSRSKPKDDAKFADFALDPLLARVLNALYEAQFGPDILPIPAPPRTDLLFLLQYQPPIAPAGTEPGPIADVLRLNTGVPATAMDQRRRLGLLAGDVAGFPNGRRLGDDVTDIAARAVVGVLTGDPMFTGFPHAFIGDGVNRNDVEYREIFPYLAPAHSGRNSAHVDPGEPGCVGICPVD